MKNFDELVKINHNPSCSYILNYPYKRLIIGCSRSITKLNKLKKLNITKLN